MDGQTANYDPAASAAAAGEAFTACLRRRVGAERYATWFQGGVAITISQNPADQDPADQDAAAQELSVQGPSIQNPSGRTGTPAAASGPLAVRITTGSTFEQGLIRKQFLTELVAAAQESLGRDTAVTFAVGAAASTPAVDTPKPPQAAPAARPAPHTPPTRTHQTPAAAMPQRAAAPPAISSPPATKSSPATTPPLTTPPLTTPPLTTTPQPVDPQPTQAAPPIAKAPGWVTGENNAAATRLCSRLVNGQPGPSPVLLWGPSGVGKSHLLRLVADGLRARKRRVLSITAEQFLRGFVDAARGASFPSFRQKHQGVHVLLIDDVQQLLGKKRTLEEFRQTIDSLIETGAQIVLTADRGPNELRELGPELSSRLAGGLSVEIAMPDVAMREQLARQAAERIELDLPEATARALACRLLGGGREVSGAINRMALLHETFETPLDERLANQVADDTNRLSTPPVRLADIQRAVCNVFDVDAKTLRSDKRTKAVTEPRMLAMYLARQKTGSPWSEIGDYFGRRSHSTVIAAHKRVEKLLAGPEPKQLIAGELGETIRRIEAALRSA